MPGPVLGAERVAMTKADLAVPPRTCMFSESELGMGSDPKTAREPLSWCVGVGSCQLLLNVENFATWLFKSW